MDAKANGAMPTTPVECQWRPDGSVAHGIQTGSTTGFATGLTKREAFAMAAMQGLLARDRGYFDARAAVMYADDLLAALSQEPQ